jgi:tetratricopeptide (TPR) repeat protein
MIAGVTPFRGATAQAMMVRQISGDPPSVCAERERCPRAVDDGLTRGLAKSPADRYQHAGEFAGALTDAVRERTGARPSVALAGDVERQRRRRWMPIAVLALAVVVGGWFAAKNAGAGPMLDRNVYAVFPFRQDSALPVGVLNGAEAAHLLYQAIADWDGVRLVNDMRVIDLWSRRPPRTVDDAIREAQRLSAGTLAWGEIKPFGDSLEIHVVVYDVAGGRDASREATIHTARNDRDLQQISGAFVALADSVIVGGGGRHARDLLGTHNLQAYFEAKYGFEALDRLDFRAAQGHFDAAVRADENFARAHLWAARIRAWRGEARPTEWLGDATQAVLRSDSLPKRDAVHALALLNLARDRAPAACRLYSNLVSEDSTDFAAWLGLGDCNARDDMVLRSTGGHVFRGSYFTAVKAYQRALELLPSYQQAERGAAFGRLAHRVLITEESTWRRGVGVPPDTQRYVAFPALVAETLAFHPVPCTATACVARREPSERRAVAWAASTLRQMTGDWVQAFPSSPDAQAAYALALESTNAIDGTSTDLPHALELAQSAAAHTDSADRRLSRHLTVVRLLLKLGRFAQARALSDSLLAATPAPPPYQAGYLANLAALTGRGSRAAALLRVAAMDSVHVPFLGADGRALVLPGDLMPSVLALRAYAALDLQHDSVRALHARIESMLEGAVPKAGRGAMRRKLLATPAILADDDLRAADLVKSPGFISPLLEMRAAIERHDDVSARAAGARWTLLADGYAPGTVGIDRTTAFADMLLALGDTAAATRELDVSLDMIARARSILLDVTPQAAAVGRALLMRAQLAARAGDKGTARRRFADVQALWSGGDAEARAQLDSLRRRI